MLTVSPALVSNAQAPANETADATLNHAAKLEPLATAASPLNGIVPDGGLHPVARAGTAPQSTAGLQTLIQHLLTQLQGKINVGGASTGAADPPSVSNARAKDPMSQLMQLLEEIVAQIKKQ
jgi:hypothetical protein